MIPSDDDSLSKISPSPLIKNALSEEVPQSIPIKAGSDATEFIEQVLDGLTFGDPLSGLFLAVGLLLS